jgi:aminoglycoside phosphotransferase (APT) family kinase protein
MILRTEDPTRHFTCMKAAAAASIAPRVHYASVEDRVFITDFVETRPFPVDEAAVRLPRVLRALHALPPSRLPCHFNTTCTFMLTPGPAVDGFLRKFQDSNALTKEDSDEVLGCFALLAAVYPRDENERVLCHNDLFKPDNILFDGDRVWLIDWEATFDNDPYADLAAMANLCVFTDADEDVYLTEYFGSEADEYQRARFFLARQLVHIFYSVHFLAVGSTGDPAEARQPVDFQDLQRRLWAGEFYFVDKPTRAEYGRAHWQQLVRNVRGTCWHDALCTVARISRAIGRSRP